MPSQYSDSEIDRTILTLESIKETIIQLEDWNREVKSTDDYYSTTSGMQLLAANCTLLTAIGEGINRINRILPNFQPRQPAWARRIAPLQPIWREYCDGVTIFC